MATAQSNNSPFAEVVSSSLEGWIAHCWKWDEAPEFGSLVQIQQYQTSLFGVVHHMETAPIDPSRAPFAYQKTEKELRQDHPQIYELLKTTVNCVTLGYATHKHATHEHATQRTFQYRLPSQPPKIHAFVSVASTQTAKAFFNSYSWLHTFFGADQLNRSDELLLAILEQHADALLTEHAVQNFIDVYCLFTSNEYRQTKLFLQRLELLIHSRANRLG